MERCHKLRPHRWWVILILTLFLMPTLGCSENIPEFIKLLSEEPDDTNSPSDPLSATVSVAQGQSNFSEIGFDIHFTFEFSEAIDASSFTESDLTFKGAATYTCGSIVDENMGTMFTVTCNAGTTGSVQISLPAGAVESQVGALKNLTAAEVNNLVTIVGDIDPPLDPFGLANTASSDTSVTLSWTSGGGSTNGFQIAYRPGTIAPIDCESDSLISPALIGSATEFEITSLNSASNYSFRVCAINGDNPVEFSSGQTITVMTAGTGEPPPPDPTLLPVTNLEPNSLKLNWSSGGGSTATYQIAYTTGATAPPDCDSATVITSATVGADTFHTVSGLIASTQYSFRVCALNSDFSPDVSAGVTITETTPEPLPQNPSNPVFVEASNSTIDLTWGNGGGTTVAFQIAYQAGGTAPADCGSGTVIPHGTVGTATAYRVTGLSASTQYAFRICAVNSTPAFSIGAMVNGTTLVNQAPPPNPISLASGNVNTSSIELNWNSGGGTTAKYQISYQSGGTAPADCTSGNVIASTDVGASTTYTVNTLSPGTQYSFRVCALNSDVPPDFSAGTTFTESTASTVSTLNFTTTSGSIGESGGSKVITVSLSPSQPSPVTVDYDVTDNGNAADISTTMSGTLTFLSGETIKTITINIVDDSTPELAEIIDVDISNPIGNATLGGNTNYVLTINQNDLPKVTFNTANVRGDEGDGNIPLSLSLDVPASFTVSVDVDIDGGAGSTVTGSDILGGYFPKTVTFSPGSTHKVIGVPIVDEQLDEGHEDEFLGLKLTSLLNGGVGLQTTSKVFVRDNDYCNGFRVLDYPFANSNDGPAGTPSDPFIICTPQQLNTISDNAGFMNLAYKLMAPLNMSRYTGSQYNPIGTFSNQYMGEFDFNDFTVSNLSYNESRIDVGLFGVIGSTGVVKNLKLINSGFTGSNSVGAVVGRSYGTIKKVSVFNTSVTGDTRVGGIVGFLGAYKTLEDSFANNVNVTASDTISRVGGIVGATFQGTRLSRVFATGVVNGNSKVGGLVGEAVANPLIIEDSFADTSVNGNSAAPDVGLLIGEDQGGTFVNVRHVNEFCGSINSGAGGCNSILSTSVSASLLQSHANPLAPSWDLAFDDEDGTENIWITQGSDFPDHKRPDSETEAGQAGFIFATSNSYTGNMLGLTGAHSYCNAVAQLSSLPHVKLHTYRAIVSTSAVNASSFVPNVAYWLPTLLPGDKVTNQIWNGSNLLTPIQRDEDGLSFGLEQFWTGTDKYGNWTGNSCANWTSNSTGNTGTIGDTTTSSPNWIDSTSLQCDQVKRIRCVSID